MGAVRNTALSSDVVRLSDGSNLGMGMVLIDVTGRIVAFDSGAAAIFHNPDALGPRSVTIPQELLDAVRNCRTEDLSSFRLAFRMPTGDYTCHAYPMNSHLECPPRTILALHVERTLSGPDALDEMAARYRLTSREHQVLQGIAVGLTTKELATRLAISPNTVKAFLRLIMTKLGVTTRTAIVAKLLEQRRTTKNATAIAERAMGAGGSFYR